MRVMFTVLMLVLMWQISFAQQRSVNGVVTDMDNNPLSGATVSVKGTNRQSSTDAEGKFRIQVHSANEVIVINLMGYLVKMLLSQNHFRIIKFNSYTGYKFNR